MTQEEYNILYEKFLADTCTAEERRLLFDHNDEFHLLDLPWDSHSMGDEQETKRTIWKKLDHEINDQSRFPVFFMRKLFLVAAIFVFVVTTGLYFYFNTREDQVKKGAQASAEIRIVPGSSKATLTMGDGSVVDLDKIKNGTIAVQGNISIVKTSNGSMLYKANESNGVTQAVQFNTIKTPIGGEYQVVLPDGSKVWLNAASSLTFPTAFTGKERKVELIGEAYFEIVKNKEKPFIVWADHSSVNVLGTFFNINAYVDGGRQITTLVEGTVRVEHGKNKLLMNAGQEASIEKGDHEFKIKEVNVQEAIAWKNGIFVFNDESIESIMRKLSRWYDIEVHYATALENKDFSGTISRFKNIQEVLEMLQLTGSIQFKIEGRRVYVLP